MRSGLVDRIDIFRYTTVDDGAGGVREDSEETIHTKVPARATLLDSETALKELGYSDKNCWRVITYAKLDLNNDGDKFVKVSSNKSSLVLSSNRVYRVVKFRSQRNDVGAHHHNSLIIQQEKDRNA